MASISRESNGQRLIQFVAADGKRLRAYPENLRAAFHAPSSVAFSSPRGAAHALSLR